MKKTVWLNPVENTKKKKNNDDKPWKQHNTKEDKWGEKAEEN